MVDPTYAPQLVRDAVDGLLKQAGKKTQQEVKTEEITIDPETQKKIIEREIRIAADPDFALTEEAKLSAAERMRRGRERPPASPPEKTAEPDKVAINKEIGATAKTMLDMGIPPNVVAQYLVGSSTPQVPIAFAGGGNQGLTLTDVLTLVDRMNANKGHSDLENIVKEMRDEIKTIKNQPREERMDPIKTQASQLEGLTQLVNNLVELGVVQRPSIGSETQGKNIEVVKEENRHSERIEEIKNDRWYKEQTAAAFGGIIEDVGRGYAHDIRGRAEGNRKSKGFDTFECEDCHTKIPILPETGDTITCAKCGAVYHKKGMEAKA